MTTTTEAPATEGEKLLPENITDAAPPADRYGRPVLPDDHDDGPDADANL
jgi:hypothetical protein